MIRECICTLCSDGRSSLFYPYSAGSQKATITISTQKREECSNNTRKKDFLFFIIKKIDVLTHGCHDSVMAICWAVELC